MVVDQKALEEYFKELGIELEPLNESEEDEEEEEYEEECEEGYDKCCWCGTKYPIDYMKVDKMMGYICPYCVEKLKDSNLLDLEDQK